MALDRARLKKHIADWKRKLAGDPTLAQEAKEERLERVAYYQAWTAKRLRSMTADDLYEYISKLWAMLIWGNKRYVLNKLISDNGLETVRTELAGLIWGSAPVDKRWDRFRENIKGMGPAMISELLCHAHPEEFVLWNRRAYVGLAYLGVEKLPVYNYQVTGKRYIALCEAAKEIAVVLHDEGIADANLLTVDYFLWDELQVEDNLNNVGRAVSAPVVPSKEIERSKVVAEFFHDEVRDKIAEIGGWLGFAPQTEVLVAAGSKVDTVWEATIGNMGRVIYVFEVQTKGSIDSLIINLLKSLKNPAVQGIVAVSDSSQLEKIRKHAADVTGLHDKLKYWNYEEVLRVHEALSSVNESINRLGLVPQGF